MDRPLGANLLTITLDLRTGTLKYSASLLARCPSPALAGSIIWGETFVGEEDFSAKDSRSGWGCSVPWRREGGGYWRQGSREKGRSGGVRNVQVEGRGLGFNSHLLSIAFPPTDLRSGSCAVSGFKGIEQGVTSPGPSPCHPWGMRAKCQDMQMRLCGGGNYRQEGLTAAHLPSPRAQSNIQMESF